MTPSPAESGPASLAIVLDVLAAARASDGVDAVDEATARALARRGLDGIAVWLSDDAGFALRHDSAVDVAVRPSARGSGVGTALARLALADPGPVTAWSHGDDPAARAIGLRLGLVASRALWVMRLDLSASPLPSLEVPPDTSVRAYRPGSSDFDAVLRVNAAAFAHHPEQGSMDAGELNERMSEPWFDPDGLLLAVDTGTDEVLGFHWTKRHSATLGEVYVVGIDPSAQGRGLGRVLTLAGLHHLADGGSTDVLLYVESDNDSALAVYSRLGFTHAAEDTHVQYLRASETRGRTSSRAPT